MRYIGAFFLVILVITSVWFLLHRTNKGNIEIEPNIDIVDTDIKPVEELEGDIKEEKKINYSASLEFALKEEKMKQREEAKVLEEGQGDIEQEQANVDNRNSINSSKSDEVRNNNKSEISKVVKDGKEVIEIDESPNTIIDETVREYKEEAKQEGIDWGDEPKPSGKMPNGDIPAGGKQGVGDWN